MIANAVGQICFASNQQQRSAARDDLFIVARDFCTSAQLPIAVGALEIVGMNSRHTFEANDVEIVQRECARPVETEANLAIGERRHLHSEALARGIRRGCRESQTVCGLAESAGDFHPTGDGLRSAIIKFHRVKTGGLEMIFWIQRAEKFSPGAGIGAGDGKLSSDNER